LEPGSFGSKPEFNRVFPKDFNFSTVGFIDGDNKTPIDPGPDLKFIIAHPRIEPIPPNNLRQNYK
jgi:hypothetical protein